MKNLISISLCLFSFAGCASFLPDTNQVREIEYIIDNAGEPFGDIDETTEDDEDQTKDPSITWIQ